MRKLLTNKFILLLILIAVFFFFGSITNTLSLDNRAVVVGLGLDYEDDQIILSCQTLVAGGTGADKVSNNTYAVTSAKAKTLGECLQKISLDSAEFLSFAHCNSILVSQDMANTKKLRDTLVELLLNSKMMENTSLILVEEKAKDMLNEKIAINLMASFSTQRALSFAKERSSVVNCTVEDYLTNSLSPTSAIVMPILTKGIDVDESSSQQNQSDEKILLSLRKGVCLTAQGVVGFMSEEDVLLYNMVKKNFSKGSVSTDINGKSVAFEILSKKSRVKPSVESEVYGVECEIELDLADMQFVNSYGGDNERNEIVKTEYSALLQTKTDKLYDRFSALGVDIFSVYKTIYAKCGKNFKAVYPNFSSEILFKSEYKINIGS